MPYMTMKKKRILSLLLALALCVGMIPAASAAQVNGYHDPAEHWLSAVGRTNELDANAVVTHETFNCADCGKATSFLVYRTPEYTRDGRTAMNRNVKYSDGTCIDEVSRGNVNDGTPGVDATYTGYHWTKATCETCGTLNSNMGSTGYAYGRNVYWLYDCAAEFTEDLPKSVSYEYADSRYHTKTTKGGTYCCFCYGTNHEKSSTLERHDLDSTVLPQLANQRFVEVDACAHCDYTRTEYTAAKAVIASYYGVADGAPHTISVTDLSDAGVSTAIRYGNSAESCTMTSAPNYTEAGQYAVYYEITYAYGGERMTENGAANVWLRDETTDADGNCTCGCGDPDCGCQDKNCGGNCCNQPCTHNFTPLDSVAPTCCTLGYDRYLCVDCGKIEKRDYEAALGHAWQGVTVREADCVTDGKLLEICHRCGEVKVTETPRGEHEYQTYTVAATCTSPGYEVRECANCGDRHIENITAALPHDYKAHTDPAACETGGRTVHLCAGCGSSFITDYTAPLGHSWDEGTPVTGSTCTGEGMTEYRCTRCGAHRLEGDAASGHVPGDPATCTEPQLCTKCGAVIETALGHDYQSETTGATCTEMGFTVYTCTRCGDSYKGDYADVAAHDYKSEVTKPTCTEMGFTTFTCNLCGDTYKGEYTKAAGHKPGDWIIDKQPTTTAEGSKHKECTVCGVKLDTAAIEKIYNSATTDTHGEATVGGYLVTVTDTDTRNPVSGAAVALDKNNALSVRLPNSRLLDYDDQTTVAVQLVKDKSAVANMAVSVTDKNDNYSSGKTDKTGKLTVPGTSGVTDSDGKTTAGYEDADGDRFTLTVHVERYETGRPVEGAGVSIGKTGNITVTLPKGVDMDEDHRITVIVTDHKKTPQEGVTVIVKGDLNQKEQGETDGDGALTVPAVEAETQRHGAYIYGYGDGSFGPERSMTRSEAAAIFARLLADRNGDRISAAGGARFSDVPAGAWYAGYVRYLTSYGVVYGRGRDTFAPDEAITRAEFTAFAVRFFSAYGDGDPENMERYDGFTDVRDGYWAAQYIHDAAAGGWIVGYGDGSFRGDATITRAEAVTIINRLLGREADADYIGGSLRRLNTFPDVPRRHWAYYAVMEAANGHSAAYEKDGGEEWGR